MQRKRLIARRPRLYSVVGRRAFEWWRMLGDTRANGSGCPGDVRREGRQRRDRRRNKCMARESASCCADFLRSRMNRRTALTVGGLGLAGLNLPSLLRAESTSKRKATARSVIMLFQFGGPSQFETFDPKPNAPAEIRGEFKPIPSSVPGTLVTEHLPRLAKLAHKYALVRSVHHTRSAHNPGAYYSLTGREPLNPLVTANASAIDFPHPGSVVDYLSPGEHKVPPFVSLPTMIADGPFRPPGEFGGFLGKAYDPLWILSDPNAANFSVPEVSLPKGVDVERIEDRRGILDDLDRQSRLADRADAI